MRKPFYVDTVEVTAENREEVATWTGGEILNDKDGWYIKVDVIKPMNQRQTKAYAGDYILKGSTGFKVFTKAAFDVSFRPAPSKPAENNSRSPRGAKDRAKAAMATKRSSEKLGELHSEPYVESA